VDEADDDTAGTDDIAGSYVSAEHIVAEPAPVEVETEPAVVLVAVADADEPSSPESEPVVVPPAAPSTGSEIWSAFEKQREERSTLAEIDLRPRQGRLTSRRSGAGV
jgi:hypothetical protein